MHVKNLNPEFCRKIRQARREAGISQSELASEVGCKQAALSMFEQGNGTKLNDEVIRKLSVKFNIEIPQAGEGFADNNPPRLEAAFHPVHSGFCPNPECPSNRIYVIDNRRLALPERGKADPVGGKFCAFCGEVLERSCPNCGAAVHEGAVCSHCGQPYIAM